MSAAAARGPLAFLLNSQTGQWVTISLGAMYAFPEQAKLVLGDLGSYATLARQMSGFTVPTLDEKAVEKVQPQSIIIHQTLPSNEKNQVTTLLIKVVVGGSACWLGYVALTNALPDFMQEMLPVTRKFFAKTSKFLVSSIEQVKNVLEEQIGIVSKKQDDLSRKLDGTHESVEGLHRELGDARGDLDRLGESMSRQELTLNASHKTMSYTSKGVTLLVRCVASMLPSNDRTVHDLAEYIKDGEDIKKHEDKQEQQRRIQGSAMKTPVSSMMSPAGRIAQHPQILIRESRADSDMDSLEDVHSVLGIKPGQSMLMT
mmetsp:Transcript_18564/g.46014  ORF Transcript_18564/g.46014 Transcript_18564/m.46014 type:complete len:315 (-) Transcript_18564:181-1125(-)